jgi:uncharacterized protein YoxC
MTDHTWLIITISAVFLLLLLGLMVAIGLLIYLISEMKKTASALEDSIRKFEERLNPVLTEAEHGFRSVRRIADDVGSITGTARNLAEASNDIIINLRALSRLISDLQEGVSLRFLGMRTGVKTALSVLMQQVKQRR